MINRQEWYDEIERVMIKPNGFGLKYITDKVVEALEEKENRILELEKQLGGKNV